MFYKKILIGGAIILLLTPSYISASSETLVLSELKTKLILGKSKDVVNKELSESMIEFKGETTKLAAIALTQRAVSKDQIHYMLQEYPWKLTKEAAITTLKLGYSLLTSDISSVMLDTLEDFSVEQAKKIAKEELTKYEIKSSSGNIELSYENLYKKDDNAKIQYVVVYKPITETRGKVAIAFYSRENKIPPHPKGFCRWPTYRWSPNDKIPPFILRIKGEIEQKIVENYYTWVTEPSIKVKFPDKVPQVTLQHKSSPLSIITSPFSWIKNKIQDAFSSDEEPQTTEVEQLKQSIQSLKQTVQKQQKQETEQETEQKQPSLDVSYIEGMKMITDNLGDITEQNQQITEEIAKILEYQTKISKWQMEETETSSTSTQTTTISSATSSEAQPQFCSLTNLNQPFHQALINEVAWMGTTNSSHDEWIEIKNASSKNVNLKGWQLITQDHSAELVLSENFLSPQNLYLLERTDDQSVPNKKADEVYTGGLSNQNEVLFLFDKSCNLQDVAIAQSQWPAGDNDSKRTMERNANLDWQTSSYVGGTPKSENSSGYVPPQQDSQDSSDQQSEDSSDQTQQSTDTESPLAKIQVPQKVIPGQAIILDGTSSGDNQGIVSYKWDTTDDGKWNFVSTDNSLNNKIELENGFSIYGTHKMTLEVADAAGNTDQETIEIEVVAREKIIITEIQIKGKDSKEDFIELYNPSSHPVNLKGYQLRRRTAGITEDQIFQFDSSHTIPAHDYYLWASNEKKDYPASIGANVSSNKYIAATNSIALVNPFEEIVDQLAWGQNHQNPYVEQNPFPISPPAHKSLGRKFSSSKYQDTDNNQQDFKIQPPTPRTQNQSFGDQPPESATGTASQVVISEIQKGNKEFVELYNPSEQNVPFCSTTQTTTTCWSLALFSPDRQWNHPNDQWSFPRNQHIPPNHHFLIQLSGKQASTTPDWRLTTSGGQYYLDPILTNANSLVLFQRKIDQTIPQAQDLKIDAVGWSNDPDQSFPVVEKEPAPALSSAKNLTRQYKWVAENYQDTNNNAADFFLAAPSLKAPPTAPPQKVIDLAVDSQSSANNSIVLEWSIPTDPDSTPQDLSYQVRYRKEESITKENWEDGQTISVNSETHFAPDQKMTITIPDLYYDSTYHFRIKTVDQHNNQSLLSNDAFLTIPSEQPIWPIQQNNLTGPNSTPTLSKIFPHKKEIHWNANNWYSTPAIDQNGTIYFTGQTEDYNNEDYSQNLEGRGLYAFNSQGQLKWFQQAGGATGRPIIGNDGTVYFLYSNGIGAVSPQGKLKWKANGYPDYYNQQLFIDGNNNLYLATGKASSQLNLRQINSEGEETWSHALGDINHYATLDKDKQDNLYLGYDSQIIKMTPQGNQQQKIDISTLVSTSTQLTDLAVNNGQIYFEAKKTTPSQRYYIGLVDHSKLVSSSNTLRLKGADNQGNVYYLSKRTTSSGYHYSYLHQFHFIQETKWKSSNLGRIDHSQLLIDSQQNLYLVSSSRGNRSRLRMFSPTTQFDQPEPRWKFEFSTGRLGIGLGKGKLFLPKGNYLYQAE